MPFIVPSDHPVLPGHFPGDPLVPGVLILDRVVEAAEAAGAPADAHWHWPQVKFLQPLRADEPARIALEAVGEGAWRFAVWRDDTLLARGELKAVPA